MISEFDSLSTSPSYETQLYVLQGEPNQVIFQLCYGRS